MCSLNSKASRRSEQNREASSTFARTRRSSIQYSTRRCVDGGAQAGAFCKSYDRFEYLRRAARGDTRTALEQAGYKTVLWRDDTQAGLDWFKAVMTTPPQSGPNLGLVMGPDFATMTGNLADRQSRSQPPREPSGCAFRGPDARVKQCLRSALAGATESESRCAPPGRHLLFDCIKTLSETAIGVVRRAKSRFPRLLERLRKRETDGRFEGNFTRPRQMRRTQLAHKRSEARIESMVLSGRTH